MGGRGAEGFRAPEGRREPQHGDRLSVYAPPPPPNTGPREGPQTKPRRGARTLAHGVSHGWAGCPRISSPGGAARTPTPHQAGIKNGRRWRSDRPSGAHGFFRAGQPTAHAVGNGSFAAPRLGLWPLRGPGDRYRDRYQTGGRRTGPCRRPPADPGCGNAADGSNPHPRVGPQTPRPGGAANQAPEGRQNPSPWREPWGGGGPRISSPGGATRTPTRGQAIRLCPTPTPKHRAPGGAANQAPEGRREHPHHTRRGSNGRRWRSDRPSGAHEFFRAGRSHGSRRGQRFFRRSAARFVAPPGPGGSGSGSGFGPVSGSVSIHRYGDGLSIMPQFPPGEPHPKPHLIPSPTPHPPPISPRLYPFTSPPSAPTLRPDRNAQFHGRSRHPRPARTDLEPRPRR